VSSLCKSSLDMILKKGKLNEAKEYVKSRLLDLIEEKVSLEGKNFNLCL
jgi:hypothetical protein